jgi:hypothetical protein
LAFSSSCSSRFSLCFLNLGFLKRLIAVWDGEQWLFVRALDMGSFGSARSGLEDVAVGFFGS